MSRVTSLLAAVVIATGGLAVATTQQAGAAPAVRQIANAGTTSLVALPDGPDTTFTATEFAGEPRDAEGAEGEDEGVPGPVVDGAKVRPAGRELKASFNGLNFRQQRLANGGNQFSVEPPDQGLCAGNGFVLESVNDVIRVFDTQGNPVTGVADLNSFYGYPPAINRTTGVRGPFVTDPVCTFDKDTSRWFHVVLTLDVNPATGAFLGPNHLDVAVSSSADPTKSWTIYRLPVQDDGTQGTPDHKCSDPTKGPGGLGPCIGDYPHIGADAYGFYITTNEYSLRGPEFHGAQIYAMSKRQLAKASPSLAVVQLDDVTIAGIKGFTVAPASAPVGGNDLGRKGTEYFLSGLVSNQAAPPPETPFGEADRVVLWSLSNTRSLDSASPDLTLSSTFVRSQRYTTPPPSAQKDGPAPLKECLNDSSNLFGPGLGCWAALVGSKPPAEKLSNLDSGDGRMLQTTYFHGKVYGALAGAVVVAGKDGMTHEQAGAAWFVVSPEVEDHGLTAEMDDQGYVAVGDNNVIYPAVGVTASGKALVAFTLVGADHFPSAAYAFIGDDGEHGAVHVAAEGVGPQDGFSGYNAISGRPRWGDYGATAVVGDTVFVASEYIAQSCTLAQYTAAPFGSCGGTRATLGNWATRISVIRPGS